MSFPSIQNSFVSGELSPSILGRTDKAEYRNGASTMRNFFVGYRGGAVSRAGFAYVGMCKQGAPNSGGTSTSNPPRDINFQYNINQGYALEFGDQYMRVKYQGAYVTESAKTITGVSNTNPVIINSTAHGYSNGDWVYISGVTDLDGLTFVVINALTDSFQLQDLFGISIDATSFPVYVSGGTSSRIYTAVSPYAAIDLLYLKFTQSANIMNLACWNQVTNTEYPPYNLQRVGQTNWTFTQVSYAAVIAAPSSVTAAGLGSTGNNTWYSYVVTAQDKDGNESVASVSADCLNNNISINAGSNIVNWSAVTGATGYNIYRAQPAFTTSPFADPGFIGLSYGYVGFSFGLQFTDGNIIADYTRTPPQHSNPFARGAITTVNVTGAGSGYTQPTVGYSITTIAGTGFVGTPIIQAGSLVGFIISDGGQDYLPGDTITITGGTGGTATLTIGAETGTYPGVAQYFQQRLVYANTINAPDTYWMSQPGSYANFDKSIPTIDSDSISGTPWGLQINGIQFMQPAINGLVCFTGNGVWLVNGGASGAAITPADQTAQAQAQIGCSATVPPLYINLHLLYVQAKNSIVRDLAFNFYVNVFQGTDITVFSNHLFNGFTLSQWAYSEEPNKLVWAVRNDGALLSLTYIKEQEIQGWSRHDTNGLFVGVCSVIEPPVDAIYVITKRYIVGHNTWVYYSERANNRLWENIEDSFCVDAGLSYPLTFPDATLTPAAADGTDNISGVNLITGGTGYTNPSIAAFDPMGLGSGATFVYTLVGGVITSITPALKGSNYSQGTYLVVTDTTGSGAVAQAVVTNYVEFTASASVFAPSNIGDVIRVDGGKATIVTYQSGTSVIANITDILTDTIQNDPNLLPTPAVSGLWSIGVPTTIVSGLNHLEGMLVSILADGGVNPPQTVVNGQITLQNPASSITIGLPYVCQLQAMYLDPPSQVTTQGKRKNISAITVRLDQSRGITVGTNQPDQSTQPNFATVPWANMKAPKERSAHASAGSSIPLFTGDERVIVPGDWNEKGQAAIQQLNPLPCTVLALVPEYSMGDPSG